VTTDENLVDSVKTETRSKMLHLETVGDLHPSNALRVAVDTPTLDELRLAGDVKVVVEGRVQRDADFLAQATGTSSLELAGVEAPLHRQPAALHEGRAAAQRGPPEVAPRVDAARASTMAASRERTP